MKKPKTDDLATKVHAVMQAAATRHRAQANRLIRLANMSLDEAERLEDMAARVDGLLRHEQ